MKFLKYFLIIGVLIFYLVTFVISDVPTLIKTISQIDIVYYISFPLVILVIIISGLRFHYMVKILDIDIKIKDSIFISTSGLAMGITPGGIGTAIKSYFLKKKYDESISKTMPLLLIEKWLEICSITTVIGILMIFTDFSESRFVFIIGIILTVTIFLILKYIKNLKFIYSFLKKIKVKQEKFDDEEFNNSLKKLISLRVIIPTYCYTLFTKGITIVMVFLIFESFDIGLSIFESSQIFFTSSLIGVLSLIPGGIIVTESSLLGLLIKDGIDFSKATALIIFLRFTTIWFGTLIGIFTLKYSFKKNEENK